MKTHNEIIIDGPEMEGWDPNLKSFLIGFGS